MQAYSATPMTSGSSAQRRIVVAFVYGNLHDQIVASGRAMGYGPAAIKKPRLKRYGVREDSVDGNWRCGEMRVWRSHTCEA